MNTTLYSTTSKPPQFIRTHGWFIALAVIASFTMFFRLDAAPIQNWDEGIHGEVSFEMVENGDWLTPHYAGGTYFRKPPLKLWITATLFRAFGVHGWTLRLPSALAGVATALLIAWWVWRWRRSRLEAFLAGLIIATMRPIFFHAFRTGEMDGMLTLFVTAALFCWWKATQYHVTSSHDEFLISNSKFLNKSQSPMTKWLALCGAAISLAVMTKSAAGLLPIPIIIVHAIITGAWRQFQIRHVIVMAITAIIVAAPWHIAMTILHGRVFWSDYIGWHVVKRVTEILYNPNAGFWWYIPTYVKRFTPYVWWFVPAFVAAIIWARKNGDRVFALLLTWFIVTFIGFTFAKTKFDWYLLPLYPAAVMLVVPFLTSARKVITNYTFAALHIAALISFAIALPWLFPTETITDRIMEQWIAVFGNPIIFATVVACTIVGIIVSAYRRWGNRVASNAALALVLVIVLVPGLTVTARHLLAHKPVDPAIALAASLHGTGGVLVSYGMDFKQTPAAYFILRSTLSNDVRILDGLTDTQRTLEMIMDKNRPGFLITRGDALPTEISAVVDDPQRFGEFTLWRRR